MDKNKFAIRNRKLSFLSLIKRYFFQWKYRNHLILGTNVRIMGKLPILKVPANGKIIIGNNVTLNSDYIRSNTSLTTRVKFVTGYEGVIKIGNNCDLNGTCFVAYKEISIGDYCQFASSSIISDTDFHPVDPENRRKQMVGEKFSFDSVGKKKISIGNNVWVGWGAIILKGVTIGDNSIIAAGAVVVKDIPANVIAGGNPAVVLREL